jgi:alpha-D-ribose 1-methylphosphonate 5-triphosphate synthase subunit PhnG
MLQVVDKHPSDPSSARREWIGLLARAPRELRESWAPGAKPPAFSWLRRPEAGLAMVRARAGGSGEKFNLGEMTVTRCALRLESGASGVAYVQGRDPRKAELAALADALLQTPAAAERVEAELIGPIRSHLDARAASMQRKAQATRVDFFTLAREAGE